MARKPQQQTLSVRIGDELRRRLERARQLTATRTGEAVSTSEIAKQFLEAARDDRLEVVDLLADPTESLRKIRRKGEDGRVLSRAEWTALAHFVRHGIEASPADAPNPVSRESMLAILDAFQSVHALRGDRASRLDVYYLGNLPPEHRPASTSAGRRADAVTGDIVRRTVKTTRRHVADPDTTWQPLLVARNLYVLLDEDHLPGGEDVHRALRPFWAALWRLAARGHYVLMHAPVRASETERAGLYQPAIPSVTEGPYTLSFARGEGHELSVLLSFPGSRGPRYPITGYPRLSEFRAMLGALAENSAPGAWTGAYFFADITPAEADQPTEVWFHANENGIAFGFLVEEWTTLHALFRRAWDLPDIRRSWEALSLGYGEL